MGKGPSAVLITNLIGPIKAKLGGNSAILPSSKKRSAQGCRLVRGPGDRLRIRTLDAHAMDAPVSKSPITSYSVAATAAGSEWANAVRCSL